MTGANTIWKVCGRSSTAVIQHRASADFTKLLPIPRRWNRPHLSLLASCRQYHILSTIIKFSAKIISCRWWISKRLIGDVMSSTASEPSVTGWGPDGRRGAVSFTFDNLGEASDIEFGKWPKDQPIGSHMSITQVVPELLQ